MLPKVARRQRTTSSWLLSSEASPCYLAKGLKLTTPSPRSLDPVPKVGKAWGREFHVSVQKCCGLISSLQQGPESPATKCLPYPIYNLHTWQAGEPPGEGRSHDPSLHWVRLSGTVPLICAPVGAPHSSHPSHCLKVGREWTKSSGKLQRREADPRQRSYCPSPTRLIQDGLGSNGRDVPLPSPSVEANQKRCQATEHPFSQATYRSPASLLTPACLS